MKKVLTVFLALSLTALNQSCSDDESSSIESSRNNTTYNLDQVILQRLGVNEAEVVYTTVQGKVYAFVDYKNEGSQDYEILEFSDNLESADFFNMSLKSSNRSLGGHEDCVRYIYNSYKCM